MFLFQSPDERGVIVQILESGYRFVLGSIGGGKFVRFSIVHYTLFTAVEIFGIPEFISVSPNVSLKKKEKKLFGKYLSFFKVGTPTPSGVELSTNGSIGNKRN